MSVLHRGYRGIARVVQTLVVDLVLVLLNTAAMFLRAHKRLKDGKEHRYWSIVENRRVQGDRAFRYPQR